MKHLENAEKRIELAKKLLEDARKDLDKAQPERLPNWKLDALAREHG